jgi:hypothetical protein
MGILYNEDSAEVAQNDNANTILCDVPVEHFPPMFVIRPGKPRRSRRANRRSLPPLYLSLAGLRDDADIARFLYQSIHASPKPVTQYRACLPPPMDLDIDIPQSLPPSSAFESLYGSISSASLISDNTPISSSSRQTSLLHHQGDWAFINIPIRQNSNSNNDNNTTLSSPSSEPETWILIDDS